MAAICREAGILTVGVVTIPFSTEGQSARMKALDGLDAMKEVVDSLIVIDNNRLYDHYGNLSIWAAFHKVDEVLSTAVEGILGIIEKTGYINVDLNDVQTMMRDSGMALMGSGRGSGENRVDEAIRNAIDSPLLNNYNLKKATKVLVNVTCSAMEDGLTMGELETLETCIGKYLGITDNYKKGIVFSDDPAFGDNVDVTIIATGVDMMGAVPVDYFDESRKTELFPIEEDEDSETTLTVSDSTADDGTTSPRSGISRIVALIKSEVSRLYDEASTED